MKKTIPEYAKALFNDDMDILENLFEENYKNFIESYWLLKDYSDDIEDIAYVDSKSDGLKIEVKFDKNADKIAKNLRDSVKNKSSISISRNKSSVKIHIQN